MSSEEVASYAFDKDGRNRNPIPTCGVVAEQVELAEILARDAAQMFPWEFKRYILNR